MILAKSSSEILTKFCDRFEGRENEISNPLIVRGELLMIADELGISIQDVARVLTQELDRAPAAPGV